MKIEGRALVGGAFFVSLYTGFQGGRYFFANRVQELGILCVLVLFAYGAILTALKVPKHKLNWNWWFFSILIFLAYSFALPAYLFSENAQVPMVPSLFASREFLITLLCPSLFFLYKLGYTVEEIESIFVKTLVALILSYIFHYFRMDLQAAYFSTDYTIAGLVTFDPWRGYRLKTPSFAFYLLTVLAPMFVFYSKSAIKKVLWILMCFLLIYIWLLVAQRSMMATLILSTVAYNVMFAEKSRLGVFFFILPGAILGIWIGVGEAFDHLSKLDPETDGVRFKSYMIAWESIKLHPLFGFGQQSNSTLTEQQIFWYKFFSADLGIIGITFKYGFVGAFVYITFSIYMLQRMVVTIWVYKKFYGTINPILLALLVVYLAFTINIAFTPAFTYIPGLTGGAFGIALSSIWLDKIRNSRSGVAGIGASSPT
jgi:hypothetical protein